jgi:hypothetical protein
MRFHFLARSGGWRAAIDDNAFCGHSPEITGAVARHVEQRFRNGQLGDSV